MKKKTWYFLINLDNLDDVLKNSRPRMGIEAIFKGLKNRWIQYREESG
ncbi:MAG: hypothetical protein O4859_07500 [Trichodesmium sp. St18_bin1]|nr:hypothetical protein [Trichodesmium sp. St18_bin1]MDE5123396.1 hypothetical protein [Trichodesmium sp. St19_bin1]